MSQYPILNKADNKVTIINTFFRLLKTSYVFHTYSLKITSSNTGSTINTNVRIIKFDVKYPPSKYGVMHIATEVIAPSINLIFLLLYLLLSFINLCPAELNKLLPLKISAVLILLA